MGTFPFKQAKPISYGAERSKASVRFIVFHYTGNDSRTDTAKNEAIFFNREGGNKREAGAHFFVDQEGNVYQTIALKYRAWSVGGFVTDKNGAASLHNKCTNANSVSIELCDCASRDPSSKMIKAVKKVIAYIRTECPNAKEIARHWDCSGKKCPLRMCGDTAAGRKRWENFLKAIGEGVEKTEVVKKTSSLKVPAKTLRYGDTGEQVKRLQRCLNKIEKAGLDVDGSFGPATLKAVKAFQKKYKQLGKYASTVDGIVGPKTRELIKKLV